MVEYRGWRRGPVEEEAAWGWSGSVRRSGSGGCPRWSWCASRWSASSGSTASWARWWRSAPSGRWRRRPRSTAAPPAGRRWGRWPALPCWSRTSRTWRACPPPSARCCSRTRRRPAPTAWSPAGCGRRARSWSARPTCRSSPGGSSGGSGAALAAGMVPLATATDGGGSIRIPAALCGLAGIKPSGGLIGRRPIPDWLDLSTDGPLATSVEDLRLLLAIEAGPVAGDPTALPVPPALERGERPARPGRVLAAPRFVPWGPLPADVAELFDAALLALERDLGLAIEPVEPERIFRAGNLDEDWLTLTTTEHAHKLGRDTIEANRHLLHPAGRAFLEHGLRTPIEEYLAARRRRFEYVRELDELLGADGVIVTPTLASAGWLAEGKMPGSRHFGIPDEVYNTAPANVTGHPSLSLPAGHFGSGVRFGLQFTGPRFRDDLLLDLGEAWQRARPWPPVADGYEPFDLPS